MIEQVAIFSRVTNGDDWVNGVLEKLINKFLAQKNEKGEYKSIARVIQTLDKDGSFLIITIFYQWVKGEPDLGPFRTAPEGS